MRSLFAALTLTLLCTAAARAEQALAVQIIEHGEYVSRRDLGPIDPAANPDGVSQVMEIEEAQFVNQHDHVQARLCRRFGVRYQATGDDLPARATMRVTHPHLVRPDGVSGDVDTWGITLSDRPSFAGFSFDEPWEVAAGPWSFAVLVDGRVLAEQRFEIIEEPVPGAAPITGCFTPIS